MLPYPHHTSAFWKEGGRARPGPSSSPAQLSLCLPPRQQQMVPRLPLPTLLGGANLSPGRQRAEEDLLTGQTDPPPASIKLKTLRLPQSSDHPRLLPRSPNSSSPSALVPTPSCSPPPATLTRAGIFAYLHMQIITFAYGALQGCCLREPVSCLPGALSLGTCRNGLGRGPRGRG